MVPKGLPLSGVGFRGSGLGLVMSYRVEGLGRFGFMFGASVFLEVLNLKGLHNRVVLSAVPIKTRLCVAIPSLRAWPKPRP